MSNFLKMILLAAALVLGSTPTTQCMQNQHGSGSEGEELFEGVPLEIFFSHLDSQQEKPDEKQEEANNIKWLKTYYNKMNRAHSTPNLHHNTPSKEEVERSKSVPADSHHYDYDDEEYFIFPMDDV